MFTYAVPLALQPPGCSRFFLKSKYSSLHTAIPTLPHCHCHPQAQHAVLIGTGIGVTPYASILQSIMHRWDRTLLIVNIFSRYWAARNTCPKCSYRWTNDLSSQVLVMMMMLLGINIKSISIPNKVKKSNRYHLNRVSHFLPVAFFANCLSKLINIMMKIEDN